MPVEIKFCGLTRAADARLAMALGASYLGFILAPSPRRLTLEEGAALLAALEGEESARPGGRARRVGVVAGADVPTIVRAVDALALDIVQLHGVDDERLVPTLRQATGAQLWSVVHVGEDGVDVRRLTSAAHADGIVLDAKVDGLLGGTGRSFDWARVAGAVDPLRGERPIILAGGLRPDNVERAIALFAPDVVDVSSGVESAPGCKDPARMRAFADAVHGVGRT